MHINRCNIMSSQQRKEYDLMFYPMAIIIMSVILSVIIILSMVLRSGSVKGYAL